MKIRDEDHTAESAAGFVGPRKQSGYHMEREEANFRVTLTMIHALVVRELSEPIDPKDNGGILIQIATLCENVGCISKVMDDAYLCECGRMDHGEAAANAHHAETGHCNWRMKK